jgi:hypothetical protein
MRYQQLPNPIVAAWGSCQAASHRDPSGARLGGEIDFCLKVALSS